MRGGWEKKYESGRERKDRREWGEKKMGREGTIMVD